MNKDDHVYQIGQCSLHFWHELEELLGIKLKPAKKNIFSHFSSFNACFTQPSETGPLCSLLTTLQTATFDSEHST